MYILWNISATLKRHIGQYHRYLSFDLHIIICMCFFCAEKMCFSIYLMCGGQPTGFSFRLQPVSKFDLLEIEFLRLICESTEWKWHHLEHSLY